MGLGCNGIGMECPSCKRGFLRFSIPRRDVTSALDSRLVQIQDEIRRDFGWRLQDDLDSAKDLLWYCESKSKSIPSWSQMDETNHLGIAKNTEFQPFDGLRSGSEPEDVNVAIVEGQCLIAADGAVGVLNESEYPVSLGTLCCVLSAMAMGK